jgi:hypothetical protein
MRVRASHTPVNVALLIVAAHLLALVSPARSRAQVEPKAATPETAQANAALLAQLPFSNRLSYEGAHRPGPPWSRA